MLGNTRHKPAPRVHSLHPEKRKLTSTVKPAHKCSSACIWGRRSWDPPRRPSVDGVYTLARPYTGNDRQRRGTVYGCRRAAWMGLKGTMAHGKASPERAHDTIETTSVWRWTQGVGVGAGRTESSCHDAVVLQVRQGSPPGDKTHRPAQSRPSPRAYGPFKHQMSESHFLPDNLPRPHPPSMRVISTHTPLS